MLLIVLDQLPDMYDIEISAHIMRTIQSGEFIDELKPTITYSGYLGITPIDVLVVTYPRTSWVLVNLFIAALLFILLIGASGFLMRYVFERGYFLELDELPAVLVVVTVVAVFMNINDRRILQANPVS